MIIQNLSKLIFCVVLVGLFAACRPAVSQEFSISGSTEHWLQDDQYDPLPQVRVVVSRNGNLVDETVSQIVGESAQYKFRLRAGAPVQILFYLSEKYVPEMQSLSAKPDGTLRVSAALMTVEQYQEMQTNNEQMIPLNEKLKCVLKVFPRESKAYREIQAMVQRYDNE